MGTIIKEIIACDKEAREAVEQAKAEKQQALDMMKTHKEDMYQEFIAQSQKEIEDKKAELASIFQVEKSASEKKFETSFAKISQLFEVKKDEWVKTIVDKCLER